MLNSVKAYLARIWYVIDILLNVLAFGQVETISSRCGWQLSGQKPCRVCNAICRFLDVFWPSHCINNRMDKPLK